MLAAFVLRFFIIFSLGVLAFVTFLVATTLIWLMWFDTWRCGMCLNYPVGIYTLALLGLLILGSIGFEAGEASVLWARWAAATRRWVIANWTVPLVVVIAILAILFVLIGGGSPIGGTPLGDATSLLVYFMVGMTNSAPSFTPLGQRAVTVFVFV